VEPAHHPSLVVSKINTTHSKRRGRTIVSCTPALPPIPCARAGGEQKTPGVEREGPQDPRRMVYPSTPALATYDHRTVYGTCSAAHIYSLSNPLYLSP